MTIQERLPGTQYIEEPKKTIAEDLGAVGAALSKVDVHAELLESWVGYWAQNTDTPGADDRDAVEQALALIRQGAIDLHRGLALLHMRCGDVGTPRGILALFRGLTEEEL
jgi:hypothetical protein